MERHNIRKAEMINGPESHVDILAQEREEKLARELGVADPREHKELDAVAVVEDAPTRAETYQMNRNVDEFLKDYAGLSDEDQKQIREIINLNPDVFGQSELPEQTHEGVDTIN